MNWFRLKCCIKCQGDLAADNSDWLCLQCGTYYYTGLYQLHPQVDDSPEAQESNVPKQPGKKHLGDVTAPLFPALNSPAPHYPATVSVVAAAMIAADAL